MLRHLLIENYALIHRLDLQLSPGLTVITGETGAGKSIILGALGLILGQRADTGVLLDKAQKCVVEGTFDIQEQHLNHFFQENDIDFDTHCIVRREINPAGKSRAFINDTPVNLNQLKAFGDMLVDIHSQHAHLLLREASFQLDVLDHYAQHADLLTKYHLGYAEMKRLGKVLAEMEEKERQTRLDEDYYNFLFNELDECQLQSEEQTRLEEELVLLTHAEEVKNDLFKATTLLNQGDSNLLGIINELLSSLSHAATYMTSVKEFEDRVRSIYIEAKDLANEIDHLEESVVYNPETIEKNNERLSLIYTLEKKHHVDTVEELLIIRDSLQEKLNDLSTLSVEIARLSQEFHQKREAVLGMAALLSKARASAIPKVEKNLVAVLAQMGMPDARIHITQNPEEPLGPNGTDAIQFLFNANKGGELKEIVKVASGGELSRLMLAVKSLISKQKLMPTLIFDEIDLGISGEVADKVGVILKQLSENLQLIVITHLPQIAAKGENHHFVYKMVNGQATHTHIRSLSPEERIVEIAKMISGESVSQSAVETAKELLAKT